MDIKLIEQLVDYGVLGVLLFMGFLAVFIWIERLLFFRSIKISEYSTANDLEINLTNNISIIYTIGVNAPYIGLLGTIGGIIITFYGIGENGNFDAKYIMSSLALALKATAFGLVIAIPSTMFYNHLARKIEVILSKFDNK